MYMYIYIYTYMKDTYREVSNYMMFKLTKLKEERDKSTIIIKDFNAHTQ
jgi:hypothetical protein